MTETLTPAEVLHPGGFLQCVRDGESPGDRDERAWSIAETNSMRARRPVQHRTGTSDWAPDLPACEGVGQVVTALAYRGGVGPTRWRNRISGRDTCTHVH